MKQFSTNQISLQKINKLNLIKEYFDKLSNSALNKKLKKYKTISIFIKRPKIKKKDKLYNEKQLLNNQLDQIGKEDSIFNNDKLITNIKLETLDDITVNQILEETIQKKENNITTKKFQSPNKATKRCLTPFNKTTDRRNKKNIINKKMDNSINKLTFDLNCNKMSQPNINSIKSPNYKNSKKKAPGKTNQKNLKMFINKPQIKQSKNNNDLNQLSKILMTPIPVKNKRSKKIYNNSFTKLNDSCENTNDSLCLTSISKIVAKTYNKTKSTSINKKLTNMHFPNKSSIKNKDKLLVELQKLFTDKITLNDDMYQNMTDLDKKNCINFLLESLKEMLSINKIAQSKNDEIKEINKTKEKQIQDDKNLIKELKKDVMKLNKIIKTNILVNRKLCQKVDNLKIQLEKEKNKNKNINTKRGNTSENKLTPNNRQKNRNKNNGFAITETKRKFVNKSMDKIKNNNIKLDEKNDKSNKATQQKEEMRNNSKNKKMSSKEEDRETIDKENNLTKDLLLEKNLIKEKRELRNNSDVTNFSDANNVIGE